MTTRNWAMLGLAWLAEEVCKDIGGHASGRTVVGIAQLPRIEDLDKAAEAGIDILGWLNSSNSIRVRAQAIGRACASDGTKDVEAIRERVWKALLGEKHSSGTRTVTVTIVKRPLPDGSMYEGDSEAEFRAAYAAALVDSGVTGDLARSIATSVTF